MITKTEAIVLKTLNHGDTSKIITLYSKDVGRLKLIAKGVRSPRSKAAGLFQATRHLQVIYYKKSNSELQLFKSGELIDGFFGLESDFDRLTLAQVVVELLDRSIEDEDSHPALFRLLADTLKRLSDKTIPSSRSYWFFHLKLLNELGFRPHVEQCAVCQGPLDNAWFGVHSAQLECLRCHAPTHESTKVSAFVLATMRQILDVEWKELGSLKLAQNDRRSLWDYLWRYTFQHVESTRGMRSLKVLRQLYS